ncbi:hypothetical protein D6829_00995 [Candidatus Pacearchaeota archaeon]|nr:MAG: hypothetical protein D6829_00995 [Candidatus Pacearchaeota archaeon]
MALLDYVRNGLFYTLVLASAALPQSCILVPGIIKAKANSMEAREDYIEAIKESGEEAIEKDIPLPSARKIARESLEKKLDEIKKEGSLEARVTGPIPILPSAADPENYSVSLEYKKSPVAEFRIKKSDRGYTADPKSVKIYPNSKLARELKEEVGKNVGNYVVTTLGLAFLAYYLKRKLFKRSEPKLGR